MTKLTAQGLKHAKPLSPRGTIQMIVPKDKPAAARQVMQGALQHGIIARIGNQPDVRQGLVGAHRIAIAARHD